MGQRVKVILWAILILAAALRLLGVTNPLLDDQGWRQADTASMALNMAGHLGDVPDVFSPKLNYDGWGPQRAELEFPFFPYILAATWAGIGKGDLYGRIWAVVFSLVTIAGLFEFARRAFSERAAILAALFYATSPLTIYYGRVVMPEPISQAISIWALLAVLRWRDQPSKKWLILSAILLGGAILAKLPQLMLFPVALSMGFWPLKNNLKELLIYCIAAISLPLIYYSWVHWGAGDAQQFVSGIISGQVIGGGLNYSLRLRENLSAGIGMPLLVLSVLGFAAVVLVCFSSKSKSDSLYSWVKPAQKGMGIGMMIWVLISLLYIILICGRIPLDYYLVPVLFPVVLLAALALCILDEIPASVTGFLVISLLLLKFAHSYPLKYGWNGEYLSQALWIKANTTESAKIILSGSEPMTFYYAERYGKRLIENDDPLALNELNNLHGEFLVALPGSRGSDFWQRIRNAYPEIGPGVYRLRESF